MIIIRFLKSEFFDWYDHSEGRTYVPLKNDDNYHKPDWDTIIFYVRRNLLDFGRKTRVVGPVSVVLLFLFILMAWWWGPYMAVSSNWHPFIWVAFVLLICSSAVTHYDWSEGDVNSRSYWVFAHRIASIFFIYNILFLYVSIWALYLGHDGNTVTITYNKVEYISVEVFIPCIDMVMYYYDLNMMLCLFKSDLLFVEQNFESIPFYEQTWFTVRRYQRKSLVNFLMYRVGQLTEANRLQLVEQCLKLLWYQETRLLRFQTIPFFSTIEEAHEASYDEHYDNKPAAFVRLDPVSTVLRGLHKPTSL